MLGIITVQHDSRIRGGWYGVFPVTVIDIIIIAIGVSDRASKAAADEESNASGTRRRHVNLPIRKEERKGGCWVSLG